MIDEDGLEEIKIVYHGVRLGRNYAKLHVYQEIDAENNLIGEITGFSGKKSLLPGTPGTILTANVSRDEAGEMQTIRGQCNWTGLYPDLDMRAKWRVEHDSALTILRLKKEAQENALLECLEP
ncbi:hypothetical protein LCGC14_2637260, partial [marine sediment metagenome]